MTRAGWFDMINYHLPTFFHNFSFKYDSNNERMEKVSSATDIIGGKQIKFWDEFCASVLRYISIVGNKVFELAGNDDLFFRGYSSSSRCTCRPVDSWYQQKTVRVAIQLLIDYKFTLSATDEQFLCTLVWGSFSKNVLWSNFQFFIIEIR